VTRASQHRCAVPNTALASDAAQRLNAGGAGHRDACVGDAGAPQSDAPDK
jgi:hypothetical protein